MGEGGTPHRREGQNRSSLHEGKGSDAPCGQGETNKLSKTDQGGEDRGGREEEASLN